MRIRGLVVRLVVTAACNRELSPEKACAKRFREENDFGEPAILPYSGEVGVDSFRAVPEAGPQHFTGWLCASRRASTTRT